MKHVRKETPRSCLSLFLSARCHINPGVIYRGFLLLWLIATCPIQAQETDIELQALMWFTEGDFEKSRDAFETILESVPEHPVALYHLGRMSEDRLAEQFYLKLLSHAPKHKHSADALLRIVKIYYRNGRHKEAVQASNRLLAVYPGTNLEVEARYWLGLTLLADKQSELARLTFIQLLQVHPQTDYEIPTRIGIAESYRTEESFVEAARAYLQLEPDLRKSDSLRIVLFRAGQCLEEAGRSQEAGHVYNRLRDRFPDSDEARSLDNTGNM
ncbi:MAG: tetratricopeptide repeat protein [Candidatus Latescibacteria bacterium]|jgi:TolA-binding protein|nr:tetratricopeptide repeat protein [Candidatus Latescibacterota bacterium]